jgi:hypothetical protein
VIAPGSKSKSSVYKVRDIIEAYKKLSQEDRQKIFKDLNLT